MQSRCSHYPDGFFHLFFNLGISVRRRFAGCLLNGRLVFARHVCSNLTLYQGKYVNMGSFCEELEKKNSGMSWCWGIGIMELHTCRGKIWQCEITCHCVSYHEIASVFLIEPRSFLLRLLMRTSRQQTPLGHQILIPGGGTCQSQP